MSLKDLFDKEKGVLHKAEKRLASAEEERKAKGDRYTAETLEKVFAYLDKNQDTFDRLKPDFSRVYTRLGNRLDSVGHDTSAVKAFDRALELDEENFDALNAKGDFLMDRGMCEGALTLFDRAIGLSPSHSITRFNRAKAMVGAGKTDDAEKELRKLVEDEPKNLEYLDTLLDLVGNETDLLRAKTELHRDRSEIDEAVAALKKALGISTDDRDLWVLRADLAADQDDDREVVDALEAAIAAGGKGPDPILLRRLGRTYLRLEFLMKALNAFDRGLDLDPEEPGLLKGKAQALQDLDRMDEADRAYDMALEAMGDDADKEVLMASAKVKADLGHHEEASSLLERATSLDPDDPMVLKGQADALSAAGDHVSALEVLEKALELDVNDLDGWVQLVEILKHLEDDAHLARSASRVVELDPERRESWLVLGDALTRLDRPNDALEAYDAALALRHDDPVTMAKRLDAVAATQEWDAVLASAADLLDIEPVHERALELQAEAMERTGKHEEAVKASDALIRMNERNREAHMRKARSLKTLGELDASAAALRATIRVDKGHEAAKRLLYQVLMEAGHNTDAMEVLDDLVATAEEDKAMWLDKGKVHNRLEQPELAKRAFSRAMELGGVDAEVMALMGRTLADLGEHAEALKVLERASDLSPDDPEVHLLAGKTLLAQSKYGLAEQSFARVIKLKPRDVDVLRLRKECLMALEKSDDVVKISDEILDLDPRDVTTLVDQGEAYTAQGHLPQALRSFQRAADIEEDSIEILKMVAGTLKALDQSGDLMEIAERILELDPENKEAWTDKGMLLKDQDRPEEALRCFEEVTRVDDGDPAAHNNRGVVLADLGRYEDAAEAYSRAIELNADDVGALRNLGVAFTHLDKPLEAVGAFDMALEIDPRDAGTWNNKGLALSKMGKVREALDSFDRGIGLDPDDPAIRNNKGTVLARMNRMEDAIESYRIAVDLNPDDKSAWFNMGICLDRLKRFEKAVDALSHATDLDPDDKAAWHNMGLVLTRSGKYDDAVESFDKAAALNPRDPAVWNNRGIALDHLSRWEEAIHSYIKALEIEPLDKVAWYNKAVAYFQLKQYDEALDAFNTALEIDPEYHAALEKRKEALDFIKHQNVEKYARQILNFEHKHRRVPTKEEVFRECQVPFESIDETFGYLRAKESVLLEDLSPQELADYEKATSAVIKYCLRHKPHTDRISVGLAELLFNFPDTSIPRAKRILDYLNKVDKLKVTAPRPLPKELEKLVRMAMELPKDQRTVADIARHLGAGILTSKKIRSVLEHLGEEVEGEEQEVAIESMRQPRKRAPSKKKKTAMDAAVPAEPGITATRPKVEPRSETMAEPLVCAVCQDNPPTIRHFDCGQFICDDCIRKANATRSMSKHLPTICPSCKMPIIEGSTDEVL
jgi:superkiller protein 3